MTTAQVEKFLKQVGQDEALQKELAGALAAEDDRQAVTDLAKNKGYEFAPEELWAEVQKRQAEANGNESDELSDEELETVAGGELGATAAIIGGTIAGAAGLGAGFASHAKW